MQEAEGLVVATTFASNVARLKTLAEAGRAAGRAIVVLGRAMNTMLKTAHAAEVLDGFPRDARRARHRHGAAPPPAGARHRQPGRAPRRHRAARRRARYMGLELRPGDTFLFSSKTIPGNEVAVARILNQLSARRASPSSTRATASTTSRATPTAPTS